jgi:hypothetical protein
MGWGVKATLRLLRSREGNTIPIKYEAGWARTFGRREKLFAPTGIRAADLPIPSPVTAVGHSGSPDGEGTGTEFNSRK